MKNNKPEGNGARLIRAANMGFDTTKVLYHGTAISGRVKSTDIESFDEKQVGNRFGCDQKGFFFNTCTEIASGYASSDEDLSEAGKGQGAIYPVYLKMKRPLVIDDKYLENENMLGIGVLEDTITFWDNYQGFIMEWFEEGNYDGIILRDGVNKDANGTFIETNVVFDPRQARSVHAIFDKKFINSKMLHEHCDPKFKAQIVLDARERNQENLNSEQDVALAM